MRPQQSGQGRGAAAITQQQYAAQLAVAQQQATVVAVQRIPTGIYVILLIGPQLAGAEQFNAGDLQAGAAVLPAEILAWDRAQAVRQHLRLGRHGATSPQV